MGFQLTKLVPLFAIAISTTGCITLGVLSDFLEVANSTKDCYESLHENPKYTLLFQKVAITTEWPTDEQLADTETLSPDVIQLGMDWFEEDQVCNKATLESYTNMDPAFGAKVAGWLSEITDIFNDTMSKRPPYGYINARIKHLRERQRQDIRDWAAAETKRRQAQLESEMSDSLGPILNTALQILARRQGAIIQAQQMYATYVPSYHAVRLGKTICYLKGKKFVCRIDPEADGQGAEEVIKGIQQLYRNDEENP